MGKPGKLRENQLHYTYTVGEMHAVSFGSISEQVSIMYTF